MTVKLKDQGAPQGEAPSKPLRPPMVTPFSSQTSLRDVNFDSDEDGTDYESAFELTGNGCFNKWVLASSTLILIHSWCEMIAIGYIITPAECDLHLTTMQKSLVNSAVFTGVCITSICWGELSDHLGRRYIILPTAFSAVVCSFASSLCSSFFWMFLFRLLVGFMISATSAISIVYLGELHTNKYRDKAFTVCFVMLQVGLVMLPVFGWLILTGTWKFRMWFVLIRPWRVFMWLWGILGLTGFVIMLFLPESPRFLITNQESDVIIPILARIYAHNNNKKASDFPVRKLITVAREERQSGGNLETFFNLFSDVGILFKPPLLKCFLLCHTCMFNTFMVGNGLYLWLPDFISKGLDNFGEAWSMCDLIYAEYLSPSETYVDSSTCMQANPSVYPMILCMEIIYLIPYTAVSVLIDRVNTTMLYAVISWISCVLLLLCVIIPKMPVAMVCVMMAPITGSCISILSALSMEAFPTKLRSLTMGTMYMCGQIGAVVGTSVIAFMYDTWCIIIFTIISAIVAVCTLLLLMLWPDIAAVRKQIEEKGMLY